MDIVSELIEQGFNVNVKDKVLRTGLHYASDNGHEKVVEKLIEHGAELNIKDFLDATPILYAAESGDYLRTLNMFN